MSGNPSIRISHPQQQQQQQTPPRCSVSPAAASPMAIPKANEQIPPPLPPPMRIPDVTTGKDPGWQWGNDGSDFGRPSSVKQRSSLLGGGVSRLADSRQEKEFEYPPHPAMDHARRGSSLSTITGYRDREMYDGRTTPSEDGSRSRQSSSYRYVKSCAVLDAVPVCTSLRWTTMCSTSSLLLCETGSRQSCSLLEVILTRTPQIARRTSTRAKYAEALVQLIRQALAQPDRRSQWSHHTQADFFDEHARNCAAGPCRGRTLEWTTPSTCNARQTIIWNGFTG
jgi:hypothetical protein